MPSWSRVVSGPRVDREPVSLQPPPTPISGDAATQEGETPEMLLARAESELRQAQAEAAAILEAARAQTEAIRNEAEAAGRAAGEAKGFQSGRAETQAALEMALRIADASRKEKGDLLREAEVSMVELVTDVARKVIGRELTTDPSVVEGLVRSAVRQASGGERIVIRMHPRDLELLQGFWEQLHSAGIYARWEVVADQRIQRGGCIVDTESGSVDAQPDSQLAEIHRAFLSLAEG